MRCIGLTPPMSSISTRTTAVFTDNTISVVSLDSTMKIRNTQFESAKLLPVCCTPRPPIPSTTMPTPALSRATYRCPTQMARSFSPQCFQPAVEPTRRSLRRSNDGRGEEAKGRRGPRETCRVKVGSPEVDESCEGVAFHWDFGGAELNT